MMKEILSAHTPILLSLSVFVAAASVQPAPESGARQNPQKLETQIVKDLSVRYLLFLPDGYDPMGDERWPLILFLHGAGERGDDLNLVKTHGPPKIVESRPDFPFIVVSPQCPSGKLWSNEVLLALLDEIVEKHKVDEERIYLTGLSMGGYGTWSLAAQAPERFAAIAPICGGGSRIWVLALRNMPVWAFHGAKDPVVPLEESQSMIDALKRRNDNVRLTVYPDAGHDSWTESYDNEELYRWFLSHRRSSKR